MRRLVVLLLTLAIAGVILGSTMAKAAHYSCHDLSAWISEVPALNRKVCYPCAPSNMLPLKLPSSTRAIWDSTVCPAY
jgi:hypothetical protein